MPRISVVITVFDGEAHLRTAITSVLAQTYKDFELIVVVDDASTDRTPELLDTLRKDRRLIVLTNKKNLGPFASANRALKIARGELIARLDADDVALPSRLARQAELLDARPELGILGSSAHLIDGRGRRTGFAPVPYHDLGIRWQSLLRSPFHHSTVIMRRAILDRFKLTYDPTLRIGGDYELWIRILEHTLGANEKAAVVKYRLRKSGITGRARPVQQKIQDRISRRAIAANIAGLRVTPRDLRELRALVVIDRHHDTRPELPLPRRRELAELYVSMFQRFAVSHAKNPYLRALRLQVERRASELEGRRRKVVLPK